MVTSCRFAGLRSSTALGGLFDQKFSNLPEKDKLNNISVEVLPKKLDEEVAAGMVGGFGGVLTKMTDAQAEYINTPKEGPYKPETYKY